MAFHKQQDKPLFKDIIWAQPQRSASRAQVLIVGGHSQSIQAPLTAFQCLKNLNLQASVVLPDSLKKIFKLSKSEDLDLSFLASTPAGSLAQGGAMAIIESAQRHDCLFITGDLSSNQETERLVLKILKDFKGCKLIAGKIAGAVLANQTEISENLNLVLDVSQLPRLGRSRADRKILKDWSSPEIFAQALSDLDVKFNLTALVDDTIWTKVGDDVCATFAGDYDDSSSGLLKLASNCAFYLINNPQRDWPALTSAAWTLINEE